MATRIFYYLCEACGADTAAYTMYSECPYCHAGRGQFHLIVDTFDPRDPSVARQIELARTRLERPGSRPAMREHAGRGGRGRH